MIFKCPAMRNGTDLRRLPLLSSGLKASFVYGFSGLSIHICTRSENEAKEAKCPKFEEMSVLQAESLQGRSGVLTNVLQELGFDKNLDKFICVHIIQYIILYYISQVIFTPTIV